MIAIIPARGGSTRILGKNNKSFHGKPIIQYSIDTAERTGLFDRIVVSSDDPVMATDAEFLKRPDALAQNEVGTQEVTRAALIQLGIADGYACCIYATAPLMTVEDLRRGLELLKSSRGLDYAFSVGTEPLQDAGQFYWGRVEAFLSGAPLVGPRSIMVPISADRVCDINVEDDWRRAELMYTALHKEAA